MKPSVVWRRFLSWVIRIVCGGVDLALRMYRGWFIAVAVVIGIILAAGCDPVITQAGPDARAQPPASDAHAQDDASDASSGAACTRACLSRTSLRECAGGEHIVSCPLGCVDREVRCRTLVPSNGATIENWMDITGALDIDEDMQVTIDTDLGVILVAGQEVRGPGVGLNNGIGFQYTAEDLAVFSVQGMTMGARSILRARGERPLLILSVGNVEIAGTIDVSAGCDDGDPSTPGICAGPGGGRGADEENAASGCGPGGDGNDRPGERSGGGGGGSGQPGAPGGGDEDAAGNGGQMCGPSVVPLRGGSGGGRCGRHAFGNRCDGDGGGGGGAVQITSYTAIRLVWPAVIDAGGNGGAGSNRGGGGGGAGGGILLEAPALSIHGAVLAANGGGGGGGDRDAHGENGRLDGEQAAGQEGGGLGGALAGEPTAGLSGGNDPGGGGGGAGWIRFHVPLEGFSRTDSVVSPEPEPLDPAAE